MIRHIYCAHCGRRFAARYLDIFCSVGCTFGHGQPVEEYAEPFWSGVRACMLIKAREQYTSAARSARACIRFYIVDEWGQWSFWQAVTALQLLGEVGGEP